VYNGRIYIVTNEDAPRYRVFVAEVGNYERDDWQESFRRRVRFCRAWGCGRKTVCAVRANATSQLKIFNIDGTMIKELTLPALGTVFGSEGKWDRDEIFYGFLSLRFHLRFTVTI